MARMGAPRSLHPVRSAPPGPVAASPGPAQSLPDTVENTAPQVVQPGSRPVIGEIVRQEVLRYPMLQPQAFSGAMNPSGIYQLMVFGSAPAFPYYREIEEKDTAIASAIDTRKKLVLGRDRGVQCADESSGDAKKYADGLSAFIQSIPRFNFALEELLDAPHYGYAVLEILWDFDARGQVICKGLPGRPQELFRFGLVTDPQTGPLRLCPFVGADGAPVDPQKFVVLTAQPRNWDLRGRPILRRLYWASWFKRNVIRLHLQFLEKGQGTIAIQYPSGASTDEQQLALQCAQAIYTEVACAIPESMGVAEKLLQSTRTRFAEDFTSLMNYMDEEMTRLILGQTLATHGSSQGKGTQALGEIHQDTLNQVIRKDAQDLAAVINEQLCAPWLLWTFGPHALVPESRPMFYIQEDPPPEPKEQMDLLIAARQAVPTRTSDWYEIAQLQRPEAGEDTVPALAMPTSMFIPGA